MIKGLLHFFCVVFEHLAMCLNGWRSMLWRDVSLRNMLPS